MSFNPETYEGQQTDRLEHVGALNVHDYYREEIRGLEVHWAIYSKGCWWRGFAVGVTAGISTAAVVVAILEVVL